MGAFTLVTVRSKLPEQAYQSSPAETKPVIQEPRKPPSLFALGGNSTTLACTSSLRADQKQIEVSLIPLAWTPMGVVLGDLRQNVNVATENITEWLDQTFSPEDQHAFIAPLRDIDLLLRTHWHAEAPPENLTEEALLNPEDLPDDVLDGLVRPPASLVQCAVCRRTCVRDEFAWSDRQLCAWDFHLTVFGRRGPWREQPYEERLFETLPQAAYVAAPLLEEINVEPVLVVAGFPEATMRSLVNTAITQAPAVSYLAARTPDGLTLLRERAKDTP